MSQIDGNVTIQNRGIFTEWLNKNYRIESTKLSYIHGISVFLKAIYGENYSRDNIDIGVERYLSEQRNFMDDVKQSIIWMEKEQFCPGTIHRILGEIKKFFSRHGINIKEEEWNDLKTLMPSNVSLTQDNILSKEQMREVLKYLPISGKALALFLCSTGCRIGETLKLKTADLNLDADPPEALLRAKTTKKGVGQRVVFMSYEARNAIKDWFKIAPTLKKPGKSGNKKYNLELVFDFCNMAFMSTWWLALKKAGLDKQDPETKYHVYHIHTLRKFFDTNMTLHGMPEPIVQGLMGHTGYLDKSYKRYPKEKLAEFYKQHMDAVTIREYSATRDVKALKEELQKTIEEAQKQREENIRLKENEQYLNEIFKEYDIANDRPLQQRMVDLIHKFKDQIQAIPQPSKSEEIQPIETPIKLKEIPEQPYKEPEPQPIEKPKQKIELTMLRACPLKGTYVEKRECDQCYKTNTFIAFSDCYNARARFKAGKPNDQDKAIFDFALVNGEFIIEK